MHTSCIVVLVIGLQAMGPAVWRRKKLMPQEKTTRTIQNCPRHEESVHDIFHLPQNHSQCNYLLEYGFAVCFCGFRMTRKCITAAVPLLRYERHNNPTI